MSSLLTSSNCSVYSGAGEPYQAFTGGLLPLKEKAGPYGTNQPCQDSVKPTLQGEVRKKLLVFKMHIRSFSFLVK
jgi:hypothetical protein